MFFKCAFRYSQGQAFENVFFLECDFKKGQQYFFLIFISGETAGDGVPGGKLEPHIRYFNTISTPKEGTNTGKQITMPIECEWPTTSVGAEPMGFTLGDVQYRTSALFYFLFLKIIHENIRENFRKDLLNFLKK